MSDARPSPDARVTLQQLDPMPMSGDDAEKPLPPLPAGKADGESRSATGHGTAAPVGLATGHGAVFYLSRIQRYSSYAFTIFTSVHLATTSLIPLATRSVAASESYLLLAREIYQTRLSEPLLVVIPVVAHVAAGVGLRLVRRRQNLRRYGGDDAVASTPAPAPATPPTTAPTRPRRSSNIGCPLWMRPRWLLPRTWWEAATALRRRAVAGWPPCSPVAVSGYVFAGALAAHVGLNRLLPLAVEGDSSDTGLAYVAHAFARHPAPSWLAYVAFLAVASGHMVWGWARWLTLAQRAAWTRPDASSVDAAAAVPPADKARRRQRRRTWLAIQGAVLLTFAAWASGGLGVVARGGPAQGWVAKMYDGLLDRLL